MLAELLDDSLAVAVLDVIFAALGVALVWFGPWPRDGWFPARTIWALSSLCLTLGLVRLWALR